MRLQKFHDLVLHEFGPSHGPYLVSSHVLTGRNATAQQLLDAGEEPAIIWQQLCQDCDVPRQRWLGPDD